MIVNFILGISDHNLPEIISSIVSGSSQISDLRKVISQQLCLFEHWIKQIQDEMINQLNL